jgi:hypothetical protein
VAFATDPDYPYGVRSTGAADAALPRSSAADKLKGFLQCLNPKADGRSLVLPNMDSTLLASEGIARIGKWLGFPVMVAF